MIKEIPLYLTYGVDVSDVVAQVVTTAQNGATLKFKGIYREDATVVFKTHAEHTIENGRYTSLTFDVLQSNGLIGNYTAIETHNGEEYEPLITPTVIDTTNALIVKASDKVEYTSKKGLGANVQYEDDDDRLVAIPFQQEHEPLPLISIRPLEVIPEGTIAELGNMHINAIYNNEGYLYYIAPVGPNKFHVHTVYGESNTYPGEEVLKDNTLIYTLDENVFTHAFATDVELTANDIRLLEEDPTRIEDVWDNTTTELFSFNRSNMVSLTVSTIQAGSKYLPFSSGVQLYRGFIRSSAHIALTAANASIIYKVPPEYTSDTMYAIFYDTELDTWAQLTRTGVTQAITEIEVLRDHHGFALLNRPLTPLEMDQLCQHHNLLIKVFFDGFVLTDGFKVSNIIRMYPGTEGLAGKEIVTDVVEGDVAVISNYEDIVRTSIVDRPVGIQDFYVLKDVDGVITGTAYADKIRFDISYLNSRFINVFREYTIVDTVGNDHRIRTFKIDNDAINPVEDKLYINGVAATFTSLLVTPDLPVVLDGAGDAVTIGSPSQCLFEVLPYYINANTALIKYHEYRDSCSTGEA